MKFRDEAERIRYEEDYKPAYIALMPCYPFTLDDLPGEQWLPIPNFDGYHESNYGRTKSFKYKTPRIMKPALHSGGYLYIDVCKDGKHKRFYVHILVAELFIPNPEHKPQVNHRYGCKLDNYFENLEWSTEAENSQHAVKTGLAKPAQKNPRAKLTNEQVLYIRNNPDGLTIKQLADKFNVVTVTISGIQTGKVYKNIGGNLREAQKQKRRLTIPEEIRERIRADYATGQFTINALAKKYGYDRHTISRIVHETSR